MDWKRLPARVGRGEEQRRPWEGRGGGGRCGTFPQGKEENEVQIPMGGRGGLPVGDKVGRILRRTLSRFSTRAAFSPRGRKGGCPAGEALGRSRREEARSKQRRGPRSDVQEEVTVLPLSSSGFQNSGGAKENPGWVGWPPDGALRPGWNSSPLGPGEAPGPLSHPV